MYSALQNYTNTKFQRPEGIVSKEICAKTGLLPSAACSEVFEENFLSGSEPTDVCKYCGHEDKESEDYEMKDIPSELLKKRKPGYNILKR
jgi:membrane carboxypeptidase/penicillin-binding protein